jgi:predicted transcriptional regulator
MYNVKTTKEASLVVRASTDAKRSLAVLAETRGETISTFVRAAIAERVARLTGEMWESRAAGGDDARD